MSFFAFVFSVFIYISIFYIFNLSPSEFLKNSKFWFIISNTLIVIILVDYGAFSSSPESKNQLDIHQGYIMQRQRSDPLSCRNYSQVIQARIADQEHGPNKKLAINGHETENTTTAKRCTFKVDDNKPESATKLGCKNKNNGDKKKKTTTMTTKPLQRSQSDVVKRVVIDESKNVVRRVETENYDSVPEAEVEEEEENKYAKMSNEELNRRVEEFIQRFNRQIRLQRDIY